MKKETQMDFEIVMAIDEMINNSKKLLNLKEKNPHLFNIKIQQLKNEFIIKALPAEKTAIKNIISAIIGICH